MTRLLLLLLAACSSNPAVLPDDPVTCGDGPAGEIMGTLLDANGTPFVFPPVTPSWFPAGADSPTFIHITQGITYVDILELHSGARSPPLAGDYTMVRFQVRDADEYATGKAHVIIDESDAAAPVCIAGRFEVDYGASGRLAGWFRTR